MCLGGIAFDYVVSCYLSVVTFYAVESALLLKLGTRSTLTDGSFSYSESDFDTVRDTVAIFFFK